VNNLFFVRRRQARTDLAPEADDVGGRQLAAYPLEPLPEGLPLQVLHDDIGHAVGQLAIVRDLDEARVVDAVDRARFIKEPRPVGGAPLLFPGRLLRD